MENWRVKLRIEGAEWLWDCFDEDLKFICSSPYKFHTAWEAFRDFSRRLEDHEALMKHRFVS